MQEMTVWIGAALIAKSIIYVGSFLAAGGVLFLAAHPTLPADFRRDLKAFILVTVAIGLLATMARYGVQAGRLLDEGVAGMLDPDMLELVWQTPLGEASLIRGCGLVLIALGVSGIAMSGVLGLAGALATAASFAFVGHGTGEPRWLLATLITLHLFAVSFWLGALWPLWRAAGGALTHQQAGEIAHRFGQQAVVGVGLLVLAGAWIVYVLLGSPTALFGSAYGRILLAKIGVVTALLALAAINKLRLVPAILAGDRFAAIRLRRSIAAEACAFALIFMVTATLTTMAELPEYDM